MIKVLYLIWLSPFYIFRSEMSDTDEVQILRVKVEKLEHELQVSTDALQLARQQLQLQDKLIEDVDKLRKEVELANKRLEERDVQLQCLLQQLALTQTKCNEMEKEKNKTINLDVPQVKLQPPFFHFSFIFGILVFQMLLIWLYLWFFLFSSLSRLV